jgi:hypothetical protein
MPRYAELVYNGFWFSPERLAMQAAIDETQKFVTGTVRLKLYKVREPPSGVFLGLGLGVGSRPSGVCNRHRPPELNEVRNATLAQNFRVRGKI